MSHARWQRGNGYDDDRRRNELRAKASSGAIIHHLKWTLDAASNVLSVVDARAGVDPTRDRSEQYTYDNLYRLVRAKGAWGDASWTYAASGNLVRRASTVPALDSAGDIAYGSGAGPHAMTGFKGRTLRYDAAGRMVDDGERSYTWNGVDNLVKVDANGGSVESTFDGGGMRRIRVERSASGESHTTHFIDDRCESRDGKLIRYIVHGGRRIARLSDTNGVPSGDAVAMNTVGEGEEPPADRVRLAGFAQNLPTTLICVSVLIALTARHRRRILQSGIHFGAPAIGLVLMVLGGCNAHDEPPPPSILEGTIQTLSDADDLLFDDAIGSLSEQTTGTGSGKGSFASYPFGVARYDTSGETRKYANVPRDGVVGLDQMGARSYAADLGVWTSADPAATLTPDRGVGAAFASNNPFVYAGLSPIQRVDRDGHFDIADYGPKLTALAGVANAVVAAATTTIVPAPPVAAPVVVGAGTGTGVGVAAVGIGLTVLTVVAVAVPATVLYINRDRVLDKSPVAPAPSISPPQPAPPTPVPHVAPKVQPQVSASGSGQGKRPNCTPGKDGVIYLRQHNGREYVGQSKDWDRYQQRKKEHNRDKGVTHNFTELEVCVDPKKLRKTEEDWMRGGGGPGPLENKRHELNDNDYKQQGGTVPK